MRYSVYFKTADSTAFLKFLMKIHVFLLISSFALVGKINADITTVIEALEINSSNITVPTTTTGRLMFKPCSKTCDKKFMLVRLTPETTYLVRRKTLNFAEFRKAFYEMRLGDDDYALVTYEVDSNTVTSINIGL